MRQTTLSVPLEVKPESFVRLSALVDLLKQREDKGVSPGQDSFQRITDSMPSLHFMSMSVFPAGEYDPLFILEANFDGPPGPFWGQLVATLRDDLRAIIRCCKRPLDDDRWLYDAVVTSTSTASVAAYLEARTRFPSVFHHGNRGLSRTRIHEEHRLFLALQDDLDAPPDPTTGSYRDLSPGALHRALRATTLPRFDWLGTPSPPRITSSENISDWANVGLFAFLAMLVLSAPGLLLASLLPWRTYLILMAASLVALTVAIYRRRRGLPGTEVATRFRLSAFLLRQLVPIGAAVAIFVAVASLLLAPIVWAASNVLHWIGGAPAIELGDAFAPTAQVVALSLISLFFLTIPALLFVLRWNENRDSSQDAPHGNERMLRDMLQREDWVTQNHMGSIVLIKPGVLRDVVIRVGHRGLGLVLRLVARDGYLGSMRTVHFAHWAFLNNGSRLLFFSNFDHSWGSYLDDFIEKAHAGLTLAWGSGVGFPPTRFLVYDGASHGRQFKNWALASRAVSRFWYSAYPDLTVDQIERNNRIADGLRRPDLRDEEAATWVRDL